MLCLATSSKVIWPEDPSWLQPGAICCLQQLFNGRRMLREPTSTEVLRPTSFHPASSVSWHRPNPIEVSSRCPFIFYKQYLFPQKPKPHSIHGANYWKTLPIDPCTVHSAQYALHSAQCTVRSAPPTSFASLLTLSKYPIVFSFSVPRSIQRQTPHYLSYLVLTKSRLNIKVLNNSYQQGKDERARWNVKSSISQLSWLTAAD